MFYLLQLCHMQRILIITIDCNGDLVNSVAMTAIPMALL